MYMYYSYAPLNTSNFYKIYTQESSSDHQHCNLEHIVPYDSVPCSIGVQGLHDQLRRGCHLAAVLSCHDCGLEEVRVGEDGASEMEGFVEST